MTKTPISKQPKSKNKTKSDNSAFYITIIDNRCYITATDGKQTLQGYWTRQQAKQVAQHINLYLLEKELSRANSPVHPICTTQQPQRSKTKCPTKP
jgi:hypothetical protein